jgi:hypothetical protein
LYLEPFDAIPTPVSDFLAEENPNPTTQIDRSYLCLLIDRIKDRGDNAGPNKLFNFYTLSFIIEIVFSVAIVGFFKAGLSMFLTFLFYFLQNQKVNTCIIQILFMMWQ